ncbi:MAG: hypothetical protein NC122_08845 [Faecalibacterium sp.]|nr:hypothetical protein [Ruminococcus sp.]MCM1392743.1 hypothetical protein [Ruminococcus sp.]MCM1486301.1 hypothetical protein [Faecalibacterium sp.]
MKHFKMKKRKRSNTPGRKLKLSTALFKGGYVHNTVLTQLAGLCPIAAAATTFKNSILLSVSFLLIITACEVITCAFLKGVPRWIRVCTYAIISVIFLIPIFSLFNENAVTSLGIYLTLLCVSGIVVIRCEKFSVRTGIRNSFFDALATAAGFSAVAVIVGIIREFFAYSTIFGISVSTTLPKASAMAMPFGGLIVLGFLAAIQKWSVRKFFPNEITDTFNLSGAFEKPTAKDPGLNNKVERQKAKIRKQEILEYDEIKPRYSIEDIDMPQEKREDEES